MFNHARTLLLDINGDVSPEPTFPGEEAVPPEFRAFSPSGSLRRIRSLLFGNSPDRALLNYRLAQYFTILHSTELGEHVLDLDPRVTYLPLKHSLFEESFGASATQFTGDAKAFYVVGTPIPDESGGRLLEEWTVEVIGDEEVRVRRDTAPVSDTVLSYSITNGLSNLLSLTGSPLSFYFQEGVGSSWTVRSLSRPLRTLGDIVKSVEDSCRSEDLDYLFGSAPIEPYLTFRNLWRDNEWLGYKLGGLLAALIYRSNEEWGGSA